MSKDFTPVTLEDRERYYELWQRTPCRSLDYTLANLWGWQAYYGLEWCFADNLCWIRQTRPNLVCWAPVGDWNAVAWKDLLPCGFDVAEHSVTRVPETLLHIWQRALPGQVEGREDRSGNTSTTRPTWPSCPATVFTKSATTTTATSRPMASRTTAP